MELLLLRVFQQQVLLQCDFALRAQKDVNAGLQEQDGIAVFYGLQNLLNTAANISKALWGQRDGHAAERQELRDSIGVADDSPLHSINGSKLTESINLFSVRNGSPRLQVKVYSTM